MNEKQTKRFLEDKGKKVADLAREIAAEFGVTEKSADSMLRELIAGRRWFPVYAKWLDKNYGIKIEKPSWLKPVRERMRAAA